MAPLGVLRTAPHSLVGHEVPGRDHHPVDRVVDGKVVAVAGGVAVHRPDDAFAGADEQPGGPVDVVRPSGNRLVPNRNNNRRPHDDRRHLAHLLDDQRFRQRLREGIRIRNRAEDPAGGRARGCFIASAMCERRTERIRTALSLRSQFPRRGIRPI